MDAAKRVMWMVVAIACIGTVAMAGEGKKKKAAKAPKKLDPKAIFAAIDTDGNGSVSPAEYKVDYDKLMAAKKMKMGDKLTPEKLAKMPTAEKRFEKMDKNKDGALTIEEMAKPKAKGKDAKAKPQAKAKAKGQGKGKAKCGAEEAAE